MALLFLDLLLQVGDRLSRVCLDLEWSRSDDDRQSIRDETDIKDLLLQRLYCYLHRS
jgi:hypothetical protein